MNKSMISNRRRMLLILGSVSIGSLISFWIIKKRLGTLNQNDYLSLLFNFIFAAAVVVGLAMFLQKMNKQDDADNQE
ncbi:MAG: hypothetical protein ACKOA1_08945 [Bacteroidota bacterium]